MDLFGVSVISPVFLAALGVLAAVLGVPALRRRARRRTPWVGLAAVLALVLAADSVNTYFAYLPRLGDVAGVPTWPTVPASVLRQGPAGPQPRGAVVRWQFDARVSRTGREDVWTYLPPQWFSEPTRRFPVLYLLHGSPGVPLDWLRAGGLVPSALTAAQQGRPVIVVLPRIGHGWLDDTECVDGPRQHAQTYLVDDVVSTVDRTLRTLPARDERAIGGMSAGGFCALNVGLRHREVFSTVLDFSCLTRPTHLGGTKVLYGTKAPGLVARDSPQAYVDRLGPSPRTQAWLDVGAQDGEVRPIVQALAPRLRSRGIETVLKQRPGRHTFHVWRPALADALPWAAARMPQPYVDVGTVAAAA